MEDNNEIVNAAIDKFIEYLTCEDRFRKVKLETNHKTFYSTVAYIVNDTYKNKNEVSLTMKFSYPFKHLDIITEKSGSMFRYKKKLEVPKQRIGELKKACEKFTNEWIDFKAEKEKKEEKKRSEKMLNIIKSIKP